MGSDFVKRDRQSQLEFAAMRKSIGRPSLIKVGLLANLGEHPNSNEWRSIIDVGAINEFGLGDAPERPFLRTTIAENREKYLSLQKRLLKLILNGKLSAERASGILGAQVEADVKATIDAWDSPANSPETEARKGFNNPLIETGIMKQSVAWARESESEG